MYSIYSIYVLIIILYVRKILIYLYGFFLLIIKLKVVVFIKIVFVELFRYMMDVIFRKYKWLGGKYDLNV